jgi:ubiquinone biosynthesis monooxygenase Coq7
MTARPGPKFLPGDPSPPDDVARMIRVDQAGEYGAVRIYAGQEAVLGRRAVGPVIREMAEQEARHLALFSDVANQRRVRPTVLSPVWHVMGYALGFGTALMGERAAMACTAAVEEVIDEHYASQSARLGDDEAALKDLIEESRAEECAHREIALAHDAEKAPGYPVLSAVIKTGSRMAIWLSERI